MKQKFTVVTLLLSLFAFTAKSQTIDANIGFSPYSLFGVGDVLNQGSANTQAMGGISTGVRDVHYINYLNPAAVTERQSQSFMMDFGFNVDNKYYSAYRADGTLDKSLNNVFNMHHLVMSFPIYKSSAFKLGIQQYSATGYKFVTSDTDDSLVADAGDIKYTKTGQGGIYQAFIGAGVTLFKKLSLGFDGQYYFGMINRYSNMTFSLNSPYSDIYSGWRYVPQGFSGKVGVQFEQTFNSKYGLVIGATYQMKTKMDGDAERYAYTTINSVNDTITNNAWKIDDMDIPSEVSVGFSFKEYDRWLVGFDYTRSDWRGNKFQETPGVAFAPALSEKYKLGFEITPNRYDVRYFINRMTYRLGAYYDKSYMSIGGHQISAEGITFGFDVPVFRYYNAVSVGFDLGRRGTLDDNLVRENYFKINVSFNLHDIWFIKTLYQ